MVAKNKYKQVQNRVWDGTGKWQMKKAGTEGRLSNMFIEDMTDAEIEKMVSDAFNVKVMQPNNIEWDAQVILHSSKVNIHGYYRIG